MLVTWISPAKAAGPWTTIILSPSVLPAALRDKDLLLPGKACGRRFPAEDKPRREA